MKKLFYCKRSAILGGLLSVMGIPSFAATTYSIESAPTFDSNYSQPGVTAINASGTVVGTADYIAGESGSTAVQWDSAGNVTNLTPGGGDFYFGEAKDIDKDGRVLATIDGDVYLFENGVPTLLPIGLYVPYVRHMNDNAQVVGHYAAVQVNNVWQYHAFSYQNGVSTDLGILPSGGSSYATNVNNLGHVVGSALNSESKSRAVMWRDGQIIDLGLLPGDTLSAATAINDNDQVVGTSTGPNGTRGFIWQNGVMTSLGSFNENTFIQPSDINNAGVIVGGARTGDGYSRGTAFSWQNGVFKNLNLVVGSSASYGCSASAISDIGHIAGNCREYYSSTFRLTPAENGYDVGIAMSISPTLNAPMGSPLIYTLRGGNVGSLDASGVVVTDNLPAGVDFVSATTTQGSCSTGPNVICSIGTLTPGSEFAITITVIPNQLSSGLKNTSTISMNEADTYLMNNSSSVSVVVVAPTIYADAGVTMVANPTTIKRGRFGYYTMTVKNNGPKAVDSINVAVTLPSGFYSLTTTKGACGGPGYINQNLASCNTGRMEVGDIATVVLTIRDYTIGTHTALVSVTTINAVDTNTSNNSASARINVVR